MGKNKDHPIIRLNMFLGIISVILNIYIVVKGNLDNVSYNPIKNSIEELTIKVKNSYLEKVQKVSKTLFLLFEWGLAWFSFDFCGKQMQRSSILFIIANGVQMSTSRLVPHHVNDSFDDVNGLIQVGSNLVFSVLFIFSLHYMKNGFREEPRLYKKHKTIEIVSALLTVFILIHFLVLVTSTPMYGLSERLVFYTNQFLIMVIALQIGRKDIYVRTNKVKTQ